VTLAAKREGRFTYADYLGWAEDERWELIEGVAFDMTPAPTEQHQRILMNLAALLHRALEGGPCRVYPAPFDVRLAGSATTAEDEISTVVQPDISVVCDPGKLDEAGCVGAPDLVVEILSPSTAYKDQTEKLAAYEKHGVLEYWIINPDRGSVLVYCLEAGTYGKPTEYRSPEQLPASVLPAVKIPLLKVFEE
jgi:Uma2 family endonuclease